MGLVGWVRPVENQFFGRLEADESRQEELALVTWMLFLVGSLVSRFLGAATGILWPGQISTATPR